MISVSTYRYLRMFLELLVYIAVSLAVLGLIWVASAQTRIPRPAPPGAQTVLPAAQVEAPVLREYRGVQLGMSQEQARQKLGTPGDVSDRQDFYTFSGAESAQVFYDAQKRVMAVSVYKMVRYPRAGYFVVYSRSGGDAPPLVTVTMQKIID